MSRLTHKLIRKVILNWPRNARKLTRKLVWNCSETDPAIDPKTYSNSIQEERKKWLTAKKASICCLVLLCAPKLHWNRSHIFQELGSNCPEITPWIDSESPEELPPSPLWNNPGIAGKSPLNPCWIPVEPPVNPRRVPVEYPGECGLTSRRIRVEPPMNARWIPVEYPGECGLNRAGIRVDLPSDPRWIAGEFPPSPAPELIMGTTLKLLWNGQQNKPIFYRSCFRTFLFSFVIYWLVDLNRESISNGFPF